MMGRTSKFSGSRLSVASSLAALVTLVAAVIMTVAVLTDDTALTLTGARVFVWAWLSFMVLFTAECVGRKMRATGGRG